MPTLVYTSPMDAETKEALRTIRSCVRAKRYRLLKHFRDQMALRGMLWADVLAVLDAPADVRDGGSELHNRPKWILSGVAADGLGVEFVCVLDWDKQQRDWVLFITMY